jgi:hypothetical protein
VGSPTPIQGMRCGAQTALVAAVPTWPGSGAWARGPVSQSLRAHARIRARAVSLRDGCAHWPTGGATGGSTGAGPRQSSVRW